MTKRYYIALFSLLISLFIYLFYRTENTVCNQIFIWLFSRETYFFLKTSIQSNLHLPDSFVYSLPEGLWILSITITSFPFQVILKKRSFRLVFLPLFIGVFFEIFQLFHFSKGQFDWIDLLFAVNFWFLGYFLSQKTDYNSSGSPSFSFKKTTCIFSYLIVYLAHVMG